MFFWKSQSCSKETAIHSQFRGIRPRPFLSLYPVSGQCWIAMAVATFASIPMYAVFELRARFSSQHFLSDQWLIWCYSYQSRQCIKHQKSHLMDHEGPSGFKHFNSILCAEATVKMPNIFPQSHGFLESNLKVSCESVIPSANTLPSDVDVFATVSSWVFLSLP